MSGVELMSTKTVKALSRQPDAADHSSSSLPFKNPNADGIIAERSPLFLGILPADYPRISASARIKEYARGVLLYIECAPVEQVILITAGFVKITQLGINGNQVILKFGIPGDVLGTTSLYATGTHGRTAHAFRHCQALVWDARTFRLLVARFPVLHQNMARLLGEDLLEMEERFREVATERVALRVARQVLRLVRRIGRPVNGEIEICLSREDLAQMTGTTLFTVSRLLSRWEARGVVKSRRESITICDIGILMHDIPYFPKENRFHPRPGRKTVT